MRILKLFALFICLILYFQASFAQKNLPMSGVKESDRIALLQELSKKFNKTNSNWKRDFILYLEQKNISDSSEILYSYGYYTFINEEYIQSISYFLKAFENLSKKSNPVFAAEILFQLASAYRNIRYAEKAIYYYKEVLENYPYSINESRKNQVLTDIGNSYYSQGQYQLSKKYYTKAYQNSIKINDTINKLKALINIGNLSIVEKEYERAERLTNEALELSIKSGKNKMIVMCKYNLGEIAYLTNNFEKAGIYFEDVLQNASTVNLERLIPGTYKYYTLIHYKSGNSELAIESAKRFLASASKYSVRENQLKAIKEVNKVLVELKKNTEASHLLSQNNELLDSILFKEIEEKQFLTESLQQLAELESNYKLLENENVKSNEKLVRFQIITLLVVIILVLIAYFLILLTRSQKKIKKQNDIIKQQYEAIKQKNDETEKLNHEIIMQAEEIMVQNDQLSEQQDILEKKIKERTSDLSQALKKAKESDNLKLSFLQNISHEIRTPLNAISGFAQLLLSDKGNNPQFAEIINQNVYDLVEIVDNIIVYSKLQANQYVLTNSQPSVHWIVKQLNNELYLVRKKYQSKNIDFKIENQLAEDLKIHTDVSLFHKAFMQLVENAYKFTEQGEIILRIQLIHDKIRFSVIDTGIGIHKDKIPYIFDSFRKIEGEQKIFRGTGIGLSLVKKIMQLLEGEISISSTVAVGTTIQIEMPSV